MRLIQSTVNAEAIEESYVSLIMKTEIIRHYACVFNFNHFFIQLMVIEHLLCDKQCSAWDTFSVNKAIKRILAPKELMF